MYQAVQASASSTPFNPAVFGVAQTAAAANALGVPSLGRAASDRPSGEYPVFPGNARRRNGATTAVRTAKLRPSLLRAIHTGYEVYLALPPDARESIHGRGRKVQSFRKLANNSQMAVSTLWRALSTYLLYRRHPEIAEYVHLGVGHISVVLSVEEEYQLYFLRNAEMGRWSRRRLDDEIKFYHAYRAEHSHVRVANG